jgi:hypothetical protein
LFEEHGHVASAAFERSRVTFWEVIRAVEIHRYKGERQMQAGNAVAVNVAHWLGHQTLAIL